MIFKKPYAFFIKYFRLINLFLVFLLVYLCYRLNVLRMVVNNIYLGKVTDYYSLRSTYIGFRMYLLLFIIIIFLTLIISLLYRKKKPLYDYLYNIIYLILVFVYLMSLSSVFLTLDKTIVEQTTLKLYTDISFLVIVPAFYFIIKYILIVIGFNLSKFNFTKDIIELKQEEKDNEEVEIIFDKNTYKYKRRFRRTLREFKYYFLENKLFIGIICLVVVGVIFISLLSMNIFKSNRVNINKSFTAGGFYYKINKIYETKYDLNNNIVDKNYKFVIVNMNVKNNMRDASSIDFKRIRLFYGKEYIYGNNYYNNFFVDIGNPYDGEPLISNTMYNYNFIFKIPSSYKSSKYVLKLYDRIVYDNNDVKGSYKEIKASATNLDKKQSISNYNLKENIHFNKKRYGNSNITISNYEVKNSYIYDDNGITKIIRDKDINKVLLILDYKLELDKDKNMLNYFKTNKDFFDKFITITYTYNDNEKYYNNIKCIDDVNDKVMLSVPYELLNAKKINLNLNFRDEKLVYILK